MGKILFLFLFLCIFMTGTLWVKEYRVRDLSLANNGSLTAQLIGEVSELGAVLFLRQRPLPDPEEVRRFKRAVDRELERLNAMRRETR